MLVYNTIIIIISASYRKGYSTTVYIFIVGIMYPTKVEAIARTLLQEKAVENRYLVVELYIQSSKGVGEQDALNLSNARARAHAVESWKYTK